MTAIRMLSRVISSKAFAFALVVLFGFARWLSYREVLPSIMRDEYLYRLSSDPSVTEFPNYGNQLFDALYSLAYLAGPDFYAWIKVFNTVLLVFAAWFIYLTARIVVGEQPAILAPLLFLASPLGQYGSYLLPESAFFAISALSFFLLLQCSRSRGRSQLFVIGALMLALLGLSLVKPHGVITFLVLVPMAMSVLPRFRNSALAVYLVSFISLVGLFGAKSLLLGAGNSSIEFVLFSDEYDSFFIDVLRDFVDLPMNLENSALLVLFAFLLSGTASFLAISPTAADVERNAESFPWFQRSVVVLFFSTFIMAILFGLLASAGGDDHSNRLLLRYVEYTFPFLLLVLFSRLNRPTPGDKTVLAFASTLPVGILFAFMAQIQPSVVDSALVYGLHFSLPFFATVAFAAILAAVAIRPSKAKRLLLLGALTAALVSGGIAASANQFNENSVLSDFDVAGQELHEMPDLFESGSTIFIADDWLMAHIAAFWTGHEVQVQVPPSLEFMDCRNALNGFSTVVYLTAAVPSCDLEPELVVEGALIYKR